MKLYNINNHDEVVSFKEALLQGIASGGGLFFPKDLPRFDDVAELLRMPFVARSAEIIYRLIGDTLSYEQVSDIVSKAFNFPLKMHSVHHNVFALELFHGPTLAFKDFGARLMAGMLNALSDEPVHIVTATSGDTGAAVAHAFFGQENVRVNILYPHNRISVLQEKMFCTLGGNVRTFAVNGTFDDCQSLVKECFKDKNIGFNLNSANSINFCRILAQIMYYFEAVAHLPEHDNVVISVPSGNFGNLTAGLFAEKMGLPVTHFIAATNLNDTVPRYLQTQEWSPHETIATLSNAMDVSAPNNWPRIEELYRIQELHPQNVLKSICISEEKTKETMKHVADDTGYILEPHSAVAYAGLHAYLDNSAQGIFLCTAHPAKFKSSVDDILDVDISLPLALSAVKDKEILSLRIDNDYQQLKANLI